MTVEVDLQDSVQTIFFSILHKNPDAPNPPEIAIRTDTIHFGNDNFKVALEWPQFIGETYTVATVPEAVHARFTTNTSVQLVMLYNTQYNVSITATLCGHRSAITTIHYGNY